MSRPGGPPRPGVVAGTRRVRPPLSRLRLPIGLAALAALACSSGPPDSAAEADSGWTEATSVNVRVRLDGEPVVATVAQGGNPERWTTDRDGFVTVSFDPTVTGDRVLMASHADARIGGVELDGPPTGTVEIDLVSFSREDNPDYAFADPGPEDYDASTSADCYHCHITIHEDWEGSVHAGSARDDEVLDLYTGVGRHLDEGACAEAGGAWGAVVEPGSGASGEGCVLDAGVRGVTGGNGACADCHAPGMDGELGGRDLAEAAGHAFDHGVHCDVCHKVEAVDLAAEAGVAGALRILRPIEASPSPVMGEWQPLSFGPYDDVVNPIMGSVEREHFHTGELCGGCHELSQEALVGEIDRERWPEGRLPIHSTWSEWEDSAYNPSAPCNSCHMPPDPDVGNSADLYNLFDDVQVGIAAGWERAPGEVRRHLFLGPQSADADLLGAAALLGVGSTLADGVLEVELRLENVGPGHALPTGEPLRNLLVLVEARCEGARLDPIGGDVVDALGGALEEKVAGEDPESWTDPAVGELVRFASDGGWVDYSGFGPFGDGRFAAEDKGLRAWTAAGSSVIVAVDGDRVSLDPPAPADWDVAWRVPAADLPVEGEAALARAGAAGFSLARVLAGADGEAPVPHHLAVDVQRDNRLLPGGSWTSHHRFAADCAEPTVDAAWTWRAWPWALAEARGWPLVERVRR